ncbi:flagellar hook-associated protein 2 [mine drainage metagenome]|uniref:Filament cap protein n=1 Tax=mine drainage metagenome TaxID=410659 RepID=A0A1J5QU09_9ZZZZ
MSSISNLVNLSSWTGGINVPSLVSSLSAAYQVPVTQLQKTVASDQATLSAWGTLQSAVSSFQSTVSALQQISSLNNRTANLSNSAAVSASVAADAPLGTYSLSNMVLAQAQSVYSQDFASSANTTVGNGSLQIQVGSGAVTTVTIDSSNNTLNGIAAAINSAGAGVNAAVVYDGTGYRLTVTSNDTGAANAFSLSASGTGSLSTLSYSAASSASSGMTLSQTAQNAAVTINGLPVTSASDTVSGAIPGVTLNLLQASGSTSLTVANDTSSFVTAVQAMVTSFNTAMGTINNLTSLNSTATSGGSGVTGPGPLIGNASVNGLRSALLSIISSQGIAGSSGSAYTSLGSVGINLAQDGTLALDSTVLNAALTVDYNGAAGLFGQVGTTSTTNLQYGSATSSTQAGTYAVNVTSPATQATITAASAFAASGLTSAETLTFVSGTTTVNVNLASGATIDAAVATINATLSQQGLGNISASNAGGVLQLQSSGYGSAQQFSVVSNVASGGSGIGTSRTIQSGTDVVGTINGQTASGSGQTLTATGPGAALGLNVTVTGQGTGLIGSVTLTQGIYQQMGSVLSQALNSNSGFIASAQAGVSGTISGVEKQITQAQQNATAQIALLTQQFEAMQVQVAQFTSVGQYLTAFYNNGSSNSSSSSSTG